MSPPIDTCDLNTPPVEHHYTIDKSGNVIYVAPTSDQQFHELGDQQLDFLEEMIENAEIKRAVISLNKMRRKLFRENGLLKKRMANLEMQNDAIRHELDYLYESLECFNIKKRKMSI